MCVFTVGRNHTFVFTVREPSVTLELCSDTSAFTQVPHSCNSKHIQNVSPSSNINVSHCQADSAKPFQQERSPVFVQFVAKPSPRPAPSLLTSVSTLERNPTFAIAAAKGQQMRENWIKGVKLAFKYR